MDGELRDRALDFSKYRRLMHPRLSNTPIYRRPACCMRNCMLTCVMLQVVDAHDGDIACMQWSPVPHRLGAGRVAVLATGGADKRVRLWRAPAA